MENLMKKANKIAYNYLYGNDYLILTQKFKGDRRFNIVKMAIKIIEQHRNKVNVTEIKRKREQRRKFNNYFFTNILDNKLLNDYRKNGRNGHIHSNHISFYGRNHHAKNSQDLKVLAIMKKY